MSPRPPNKKSTIFTIGHSTRPLNKLIELCRTNGVKRVIDIRTIPRSRHNRQFNRETLGPALRKHGIAYLNLKQLGGLRDAKPHSKNLGWHHSGFRGFADYMETPEFAAGLSRAIKLAKARPSALLCAEAVPWRCPRSLVADALLVRSIQVLHIVGPSAPRPHKLTPFARVRGLRITYPKDKPRTP